MDFLHALVLALVQGITEFLPISSSAHLILLPHLAGWVDHGLIYDLAAHLGTLAAVIVYFRRDLRRLLVAGWRSTSGHGVDEDARLFWYLLIASVPVGIAGLLIYGIAAGLFREPLLIAMTNLLFAGLLWLADRVGRRQQAFTQISLRDALFIGLAQVLALVPGVSRSGITITAGLFLGLTRQAAARFSFLLSIPVTLMAGGYGLYRLLTVPAEGNVATFALVAVLSFFSALAAIHLFLSFLDRFGMLPYVVYRLLLGVVLIVLFI